MCCSLLCDTKASNSGEGEGVLAPRTPVMILFFSDSALILLQKLSLVTLYLVALMLGGYEATICERKSGFVAAPACVRCDSLHVIVSVLFLFFNPRCGISVVTRVANAMQSPVY